MTIAIAQPEEDEAKVGLKAAEFQKKVQADTIEVYRQDAEYYHKQVEFAREQYQETAKKRGKRQGEEFRHAATNDFKQNGLL